MIIYNYLKLLLKIEDISEIYTINNNNISLYLLQCKIECLNIIQDNIKDTINTYSKSIDIIKRQSNIETNSTSNLETNSELEAKIQLATNFLGINSEQNIAIEDIDVSIFDTFGSGLSSLLKVVSKDSNNEKHTELLKCVKQIKNEDLTFEIIKK